MSFINSLQPTITKQLLGIRHYARCSMELRSEADTSLLSGNTQAFGEKGHMHDKVTEIRGLSQSHASLQ